jgi:signal transduction histidine kinase
MPSTSSSRTRCATAGTVTVTVSVQPSSDHIATIDITDEGPGIPPGHEASIFRRGVTANGSGIGLALASDLVVAEHGRLTLVSGQPADSAKRTWPS